MGIALMGTGSARGESRAVEAAQRAIASPLLEESSIEGARGVLINITGGPDLTLHEVNEAASLINDTAHEDANVIFGAVIDDNLNEEVRVTVIATGFVRPESNAVPVERKRKAVNDRDDLDVPTVIRRRSAALLPDPNVSVFEPHKAYEERSLDVPTFLRRKAD
jgi:cell division protein FtsZ